MLVHVPKFLGILAGRCGSVVVRDRDKDWKEPGSTLGYDFLSFFFFLLETLSITGLKNGSDRIERFHSRGQHLCKFMGTKKIFYLRKGSNSRRICLEHQYGCRFIVLEHQYGRRDVM